jgi:serine/threonine-protein kinase
VTEPQPEQPTVVGGRYRLSRELAQGGMAQVYLARDEVLDRDVAVKMLFAKLADDERFVARFRREASAAAKLNHPNVVQVYDWHAEGDSYFIVMEYVPGQDLATVIEQGPVEIDEAIEIGKAAASALECAHRSGFLHRDIKPGNILVTGDGGVKVADFGVARAFSSNEKLTETGRVMGTAAYFSPEQARGIELGPQSDLYSLGAVLFEMVTGVPVFAGTTPVDVAYKQVHDRPRRAQSINPLVPNDLDEVIDRLLAKDPAHRYGTASELEAQLDRVASRRYHARAKATTALPRSAGPATEVMAGPPPEQRHPAADGTRAAWGADRGLWFLAAALLLAAAIVGLFLLSTVVGDGSSGDDPTTSVAVPTRDDSEDQPATSVAQPGTGADEPGSTVTTVAPTTTSLPTTSLPTTTTTAAPTTSTSPTTATTQQLTTTEPQGAPSVTSDPGSDLPPDADQ